MGAKVIDRLARDLRSVFPDMGWSPRNLKYMRAFAKAWPDPEIVQGRLAQLSWWHQIALLEKLDDDDVRLWYAAKTAEHGWTRDVLVHQIEGGPQKRGHSIMNRPRPADREITTPSGRSVPAPRHLTARWQAFCAGGHEGSDEVGGECGDGGGDDRRVTDVPLCAACHRRAERFGSYGEELVEQ
jgi:DUF1016 N-terminal domain